MTSGAHIVPSDTIVCGTGARALRRPSGLSGRFVALSGQRIPTATR